METEYETHIRPSRWQAFLNRIWVWLCRPGVLKRVISVGRLIWLIYDLLFGDDPRTFYTIDGDGCYAT